MPSNLRMVAGLDGSQGLLELDTCKTWRRAELEYLPGNDPPSTTSFYLCPEGKWYVDVDKYCFQIEPLELFRKMHDWDLEIPEDLKAAAHAALPHASKSNSPACPPISIGEPNEPITVVNRELGPVRRSWFNVLRPVVAAFPLGLSEDDLKEASGREGAVPIFKAMRKAERALELTLICPGHRGGGGYRCVWPEGWRT